MTPVELSTGSTSVSPAFSTVSTDWGRFCAASGLVPFTSGNLNRDCDEGHMGPSIYRLAEPTAAVTRRGRTVPLTPSEEHAYNRRALPPNERGTLRRKREEDIPAQYPEACEDARLPRTYGYSWRTRCSGGSPPQGTQGPVGLAFGPGARKGRGPHEHDQVVS